VFDPNGAAITPNEELDVAAAMSLSMNQPAAPLSEIVAANTEDSAPVTADTVPRKEDATDVAVDTSASHIPASAAPVVTEAVIAPSPSPTAATISSPGAVGGTPEDVQGILTAPDSTDAHAADADAVDRGASTKASGCSEDDLLRPEVTDVCCLID
jgi:hypothetical protein